MPEANRASLTAWGDLCPVSVRRVQQRASWRLLRGTCTPGPTSGTLPVMHQFVTRKTAFLLMVLVATPCLAWGRDGHKITGAIAAHYLTPEAKAAVEALLGDQSLADVSTWADEIRSKLIPIHTMDSTSRSRLRLGLKRMRRTTRRSTSMPTMRTREQPNE